MTDTNTTPDPVELVIFDCDGVLVDSERLAISIDVEVLADVGWALSEAEVVQRFVGRPDAYMLEEVERHIGRDISQDWYGKYADVYRARFEADLGPVPGIVEVLDRLTVSSCIASSGTHERLRLTLGLTNLWDRFDGRIFSAQDVPRGKPWPDLFLHAAIRMGVEPDRCVVIEDSVAGVEAARAAGMRVFAFAGGVTPRANLIGNATVVFDTMPELADLLAPSS